MDFAKAKGYVDEAKEDLDGLVKSLEAGDSLGARSCLARAALRLECLSSELNGKPAGLRLALALADSTVGPLADGGRALVILFEGPSLAKTEFALAWNRWVDEASARSESPGAIWVSPVGRVIGETETGLRIIDLSIIAARGLCEHAFLNGTWTQHRESATWTCVVQKSLDDLKEVTT